VHEEGVEVRLEQRRLHGDHRADVLEHHVLRLGLAPHGEDERAQRLGQVRHRRQVEVQRPDRHHDARVLRL
jgi:hypothetical protein